MECEGVVSVGDECECLRAFRLVAFIARRLVLVTVGSRLPGVGELRWV